MVYEPSPTSQAAGLAELPSVVAADAEDTEAARRGLRHLSELTRGWLSSTAVRYLTPDFPDLPVLPRVKACLELGLLRRLWGRVRPDDEGFRVVAATVEAIWADPAFVDQVTSSPRYARPYSLAYAGLAPLGARLHQPTLEMVAPGNRFVAYSTDPYQCLEARFYAELAGFDHDFAPYPVLYQGCELANLTEPTTDIEAAYRITHTLFQLTDFGAHPPQLTEAERWHALSLVDRMTDHFVTIEHWDLTAELVLSQRCLGQDPTLTRSGAAAVQSLLAVQTADGRIPARFAAQRPPETLPPVNLFRYAYQTTLVTAFTSMISLDSLP